jgi:hypothetical protein
MTEHDSPKPPETPVSGKNAEVAPETSVAAAKSTVVTCVDMMAFTQLLNAAQQCGLVANIDVIVNVRDCEYRLGKYQRAFDMIEGVYQQLNAGVARRQGDLRREELQYRSGTLKMSPKEWQLRQRRVTEQTQKIDRARRQFARVLDGLSVLRSSRPEKP